MNTHKHQTSQTCSVWWGAEVGMWQAVENAVKQTGDCSSFQMVVMELVGMLSEWLHGWWFTCWFPPWNFSLSHAWWTSNKNPEEWVLPQSQLEVGGQGSSEWSFQWKITQWMCPLSYPVCVIFIVEQSNWRMLSHTHITVSVNISGCIEHTRTITTIIRIVSKFFLRINSSPEGYSHHCLLQYFQELNHFP